MGYHEKRGKFYRARWRDPSGKLESMSGFLTAKAADKYWQRQEVAIEEGRYVDPRAGKITLDEWVNLWYPALDLELSTLENIRYHLESFILPEFGERSLASFAPEEINAWEKDTVARGYAPRTAKDVRATLSTCLGDAVPARIPRNPAVRGRARGKKATRRIARKIAVRKAWATPLEAFLVAERAAALSGEDGDFVKVISMAYTGARWSEITGLPPDCIHQGEWDLNWKLYELNGKFYRGWPKDGSVRTIDVPPFLGQLVTMHLDRQAVTKCTCRSAVEPYCAGGEYVFLGPGGGHARRSDYSRRFFRPAADGRYPKQGGKSPRPALPVLADVSACWPGVPAVTAVPAPGEPFSAAGGYLRRAERLPVNSRSTRADLAAYAVAQGMARGEVDGMSREALLDRFVRAHYLSGDAPIVAWLPVMPRLTPHGLRHSHETWMAEDRIADVLRDERMGHVDEEDDPDARRSMRDRYTKITERMRGELVDALQRRWEQSLRDRVELERHGVGRSPVRIVNEVLEPYRDQVVAAMPSGRRVRPLQAVRPRRLAARSR